MIRKTFNITELNNKNIKTLENEVLIIYHHKIKQQDIINLALELFFRNENILTILECEHQI